MSSNILDQQPEEELTRRIKNLEEIVQQMRTVQPIGLDSLNVVAYPLDGYLLIDDVVAAGAVKSYNLQILPDPKILTNWDVYFSVFVDLPNPAVLDNAYLYPYGASLSAGQKKVRIRNHWDWAGSSDLFATRYFLYEVENYDTISHHYYLPIRVYGPKGLSTVN